MTHSEVKARIYRSEGKADLPFRVPLSSFLPLVVGVFIIGVIVLLESSG